jgi:hypothetical protein
MKYLKSYILYTSLVLLASFVAFIIYLNLQSPQIDKNWNDDGKVLPIVTFSTSTENLVEIKNIKNFDYTGNTDKEYNINYYDANF